MNKGKIIRSPKSGKFGLQETEPEEEIKSKIGDIIKNVLQKNGLEPSDKVISELTNKIYKVVK